MFKRYFKCQETNKFSVNSHKMQGFVGNQALYNPDLSCLCPSTTSRMTSKLGVVQFFFCTIFTFTQIQIELKMRQWGGIRRVCDF